MSGAHLTNPPFAEAVIPIEPKVPLSLANIIEAAFVLPLLLIVNGPKLEAVIVPPLNGK